MTKDLLSILAKNFGDFIVVNDESDEDVEVISTGSLSLDVSVGVGGVPKGRITTIYGSEGSGKTTLCLEIVRQALLQGEKVVYLDLEHSLDFSYIKAIVKDFDVKNLLLLQPDTAEESLGLAEFFISGDQKSGVNGGEFKLIIIDSVAALAPSREKERKLEDRNVALQAGLLTPFFRRNIHAIKKNNIAVVFVNQVRDNIGAYHGGYVLPGGHALKHYASLILFLSAGEKYKQGEKVLGFDCKYVVKKNKLAPPFRQHSFPVMFGTGIDYYRDVIDFAKMLGVVKKRAAYFYLGDDQLDQGMDKSKAYLSEHKDALDKIVELCYTEANRYKSPVEDEEEQFEELVEEYSD